MVEEPGSGEELYPVEDLRSSPLSGLMTFGILMNCRRSESRGLWGTPMPEIAGGAIKRAGASAGTSEYDRVSASSPM
jgi:hypothetical protein